MLRTVPYLNIRSTAIKHNLDGAVKDSCSTAHPLPDEDGEIVQALDVLLEGPGVSGGIDHEQPQDPLMAEQPVVHDFPFFYLSLALSGHPKTVASLNPGQGQVPHRAALCSLRGCAFLAGLSSIPRSPAFFSMPR